MSTLWRANGLALALDALQVGDGAGEDARDMATGVAESMDKAMRNSSRRATEIAAFEGRSNGFQRPFENVLNASPRNKIAFSKIPEPGDRDSRTA